MMDRSGYPAHRAAQRIHINVVGFDATLHDCFMMLRAVRTISCRAVVESDHQRQPSLFLVAFCFDQEPSISGAVRPSRSPITRTRTLPGIPRDHCAQNVANPSARRSPAYRDQLSALNENRDEFNADLAGTDRPTVPRPPPVPLRVETARRRPTPVAIHNNST